MCALVPRFPPDTTGGIDTLSRRQVLRSCILGLLLGVISGTPLQAQTLTQVILPRYMEGMSPVNADRLPYAYRLRLSGLLPSRTYRYTNQMISPTDGATSSGSGNAIFATLSGDFYRSNSVS